MSALPNHSTEDVCTAIPGGRIVAIDALRGFDMFWIIGGRQLALAVTAAATDPVPGWLKYQLSHPAWLGFSAWDLIMPLFLFIVGAAMPFSFAKRLSQGSSRTGLYWKIVRRTVVLFVLGMAVQGNLLDFDLSHLHLYCNTLQAIAIGYLIASLVMLHVGILGQIVVTLLLLVVYWLLLAWVPLPGHQAGILQPDANLALAIDEFFLGSFRDGTSYTWILSSLGFAATVLLGVLSGHILGSTLQPWSKVLVLTVVGISCLAGGWVWATWLGFPIIKHIWTSSMVLWAGGWSYLLLALFYLAIDVLGFRRWAFPFIVIGMNAITIYVANAFIPWHDISNRLVGGLAGHLAAAGPVLVSFTAVLLAWLVLYHMYRQRIFLRI